MKKMLSSILCLIMMVSMSISAFAESNDFVLTYSNEASYEITIPASGTVNKATGKGIIEIDISDTNLANGTAVSVTATSANYANGSWYLVNTKDSSDKIAYTIGTTNGGSDVTSGDEVLTADVPTSATLYVTVSDTSKVGTFTDTISFTSEIVEAEISPYRLSGVWEFKDEINLQGLDDICYGNWEASGEMDDAYKFDINFTSNGMQFDYMYTGDGTIATVPCPHGYEMVYGNSTTGVEFWSYAFNDGELVDPSGNTHAWADEEYRIINFGAAPQSVTEEFYYWLTENAEKVS